MTEHNSFYRKLIYIVLIAVLMLPISKLGAPATISDKQGGTLAQLRAEHNLGQSSLGDIDPASETIRLATLGLRGVAVSMLWSKANEYKKKEDWTNFRATLGQLAKLQPYFIKFWQYQAWNLTYNVSVELDDVRDRFHYVKRGIEFLKEGIKYNRDSPYLLSELGWFIGNKIGRADEKKEYRRLFKEDVDFHPADRPLEQRDNWLVSRGWFETSISAVDDKKKSIGGKNPTTFYSDPGRSQINYSEAIERDGVFGEKAKSAWATAARIWKDFGERPLKSSFGFQIKLGPVDRLISENNKLKGELENLDKPARNEILAQKEATLTPEQKAILAGPKADLSEEQDELLYSAEEHLEISVEELTEYIEKNFPRLGPKARKLYTTVTRNQRKIGLTQTNREVVAYHYWKMRCALEQMPEALLAHDLAYEAQRAFKVDADLLKSKRLFEESFDQWAIALKAFPDMEVDSPTGGDLMEVIEQYADVLQQLDLNLSDDEIGSKFPLWEIAEANDNSGDFSEGATKFLNKKGPLSPDAAQDDQDEADQNADQDHDKQPTESATTEATVNEDAADKASDDKKSADQKSADDEATTEEPAAEESTEKMTEESTEATVEEAAEESAEAATDATSEDSSVEAEAKEEAVETETATDAQAEAA